MNPHSKNILKLAKEFSVVLNNWIPEHLTEVNKLNKEVGYAKDDHCATHDFCDPNQAMIDAFKSVFGKEPSVQNQKDNMLINNAWGIAKILEFKPTDELFNKI